MKEFSFEVCPDLDFNADYQNKKLKKSKIIKLLSKLDNWEKKTIISLLWNHADFSYFLHLLNSELNLCSKKIKFLAGLEQFEVNTIWMLDRGIYIQPFAINWEYWDGNIPTRRINYNLIKHNKIKNYTKCTLQDLIYSLWAYYILLNYLVFWLDTKLKIEKPPYDDPTQIALWKGCIKYDISTKVFDITFCVTEARFLYFEDEILTDAQYGDLKYTINDSNNLLRAMDWPPIPVEECIYCVYKDYEPMIVWHHQSDREKPILQYYKRNYIKMVKKSY